MGWQKRPLMHSAWQRSQVSGLFGPATSTGTPRVWSMVISSEAANVSKLDDDTERVH